MATTLKDVTKREPFTPEPKSKSFQRNLLLSIGGVFLLFAICFSVYQYKREKEYKIDILHSRLQMYNYEMVQTVGMDSIVCSHTFRNYVLHHQMEGLRVSVIDKEGRVILDSYDTNVKDLGNHLQRREIQQALREGSGYDIKRMSQSTHETYFYSATRFDDVIVRAAVPYSAELTRSLQADNTYIYYSGVLTLLLGIVLYYITHRISRHIGYLREFAVKAEEGEKLDHELERRLPDDELGDISHTIIMLYWKLRHSEEEKVRIKRQLTQNAAHELKTPAASIHGYLESIIDNPDMPEDKKKHFLERCFAQSERMNKLLLDMSALTKLDEIDDDRSEARQAYRPVDVLQIIQSALDDTALQLQEKGIVPSLQLPQHVEVLGDQSLIYSIFRNLIDNAIAYATGASLLSITCAEVEKEGRHFYEFIVSDNGQGVEAQHLTHLFERFYRVDKGRSRKLGGTGLGLAIVKNAVVAHGGQATALSTPGGGLTIRFTLARF
ncbi:Signal transduction histidine kinase [Prevotella communis]|uniref:histidine kinase n=1 Tax=Prevotella communis TaxID=2913614 RepID=A0A1G8ASB8_9BACT|nr:ATP-binding protein [Prevotella communis]SDH23180.1 Signal transduction histidine kinase [Prevotella communis]